MLIAVAAIPLHTGTVLAQGYEGNPPQSVGGYIDSAIPGTYFRLRFDAVDGINRSDRAQYLYEEFVPRVKYQDIGTYVEMAFNKQFSAFVDLHSHFVQGEDVNASGLGDTQVGFKWAFVHEEDRFVTFQLRTSIPTGNPLHLLGNGVVAVEPGLLTWRKLNDRVTLEGEFKLWIPIDGSVVSGNVLQYGGAVSYRLFEMKHVSISPVVEMMGWTVLNGQETPAYDVYQNAAGDTIVNVKMGARFEFGPRWNMYMGYGRSITGDVWYKDVARVELRLSF
jgi:hypothetical protein